MPTGNWSPVTISRPIEVFETSTHPVRVRTDAGEALVKTLDSGEAPGALIAEWVGTSLADRMGLKTFDHCVIQDSFSGTLLGEAIPLTGPMFAVRWVDGYPWSGVGADLKRLAHRDRLADLVVLDTWLRNFDRKHPTKPIENLDNVFIEAHGKGHAVVAMDFSHAMLVRLVLNGGATATNISDPGIFGLFGAFIPFLTRLSVVQAINRMCAVSRASLSEITSGIPDEWGLTAADNSRLVAALVDRQSFLCGTLQAALESVI